jgi:hypothetical protein
MSDKPKIGRNLEPAILSDMSLNPSDPAAYLEGIRKYAEGQTTQAINWCLKRKGPISLISNGLRFAAIVLGTIGGLFPLLPATLMAAWLGPAAQNANAQFGYVFLALAGAFVLSDKLFGVYTSRTWVFGRSGTGRYRLRSRGCKAECVSHVPGQGEMDRWSSGPTQPLNATSNSRAYCEGEAERLHGRTGMLRPGPEGEAGLRSLSA